MTRPLLAIIVVLLLCVVGPRALYAQEARISVGVGGGVSVPMSASDRFVPRFIDASFAGNANPTYLVHLRPKPGMLLQLEALIGRLSIRYSFQRFGWNSDRIACRPGGDPPGTALLLPNGEYDDRALSYQCERPRERIAAEEARRALSMHQLSGAMEFVAIRPRVIIPYATIGGGLLLTTFQMSAQNNTLRPGLAILVGGGLRIPFDRNISMVIEARYALHLMARGGDYSLRAGRAVAAEKTVLSATVDPMHAFQSTISFRMRIR